MPDADRPTEERQLVDALDLSERLRAIARQEAWAARPLAPIGGPWHPRSAGTMNSLAVILLVVALSALAARVAALEAERGGSDG